MTIHQGYSLARDESLEDLGMGVGSVLSVKVTGQQSNGLITVIGAVVESGGPPLHVHDAEDKVGLAGISTALFVLGHIFGAILMGLALRGSIPTFGWVAMLLTTPAHVVAFVVLQMPVLDLAAWLLMTVSFACCAVVALRTPDNEWDLPPLTAS